MKIRHFVFNIYYKSKFNSKDLIPDELIECRRISNICNNNMSRNKSFRYSQTTNVYILNYT